ncbi:DUF6290 family protein [Companilactobacillus kedongensis]|uniref:DUF6290 family protein n=1 Tax=Companilactobacillus kedongensis TaxID=2486004 RepID=UPI000F7765BE|nr:DUF6290 family protein [Companilactobacillus kedongensis]
MTTQARSIRIDSNLDKAINDYLKVTGQSFNSFAETAMADKLEDLLDMKDYSNVKINDDGSRFTVDEVVKKLGIDL